jgi:porphobilinogen deaminase
MARSGLERVGLADRIAYEFPAAEMLPAVGQGIVAVECAAAHWQTRMLLSCIDDATAHACADEVEVIHFRGAADTRVRKLDHGEKQRLPEGGSVGPSGNSRRA